MKKRIIYEMPVYCGRTKVWRVLNLSSLTVYSGDYEDREAAFLSIRDGEERCGDAIIKAIHEPSEIKEIVVYLYY